MNTRSSGGAVIREVRFPLPWLLKEKDKHVKGVGGFRLHKGGVTGDRTGPKEVNLSGN